MKRTTENESTNIAPYVNGGEAQKDDEINDVRIRQLKPLIQPAILIEELPLTDKIKNTVYGARKAIDRIVKKKDDRLLVVVGPCSIHDTKAGLEYGTKLYELSKELKDDLLIVMRVYFEKPRTTVGWKGLINDPFLDGSFQINKGLKVARSLLAELNELGLPCGVEFLDTITPQYVADLVSWGAIGARTTESQVHRELASGLSMSIGFKNGTTGNVEVAVEAVKAASSPHCFLSVGKLGLSAIACTTGNDSCHIILRGARDSTNYDAQSVESASQISTKMGIPPSIMIDFSHGNSSKLFSNQPKVAEDVAKQIASGNQNIIGVMIESFLVQGTQKIPAEGTQYLVYGQSITDGCISWASTVPVLKLLAKAVADRRKVINGHKE